MAQRNTPTLRWGLLSTARINQRLIPAIRQSRRSQLTAVASRSLEQAQSYAGKHNIPHAFGSYEAMLADPDIDVIYNPLPNSLHADWSIQAVQAGKHVLCEKPLALSADEVDAVEKAAGQSGKVVAEAFMYRHHPQTLKVKQLVDDGYLGELRLIRGSFTYTNTRPNDVRFDLALGGGSIWDVGCYPISYARYLIGAEPIQVFGSQLTTPTGIDGTFVGQMQFPGDIYAQFDCSFFLPYRVGIEVFGSLASMQIPMPYTPDRSGKIYVKRNDNVETIRIASQTLYLGEVIDMEDAILLGKSPRISLIDSRYNVTTIQALLQSASENRPVSLAPEQ